MRTELPADLITPVVQQRVDDIKRALPEEVLAVADFIDWLEPLCAVSPYLAKVAAQYPDEVSRLVRTGMLNTGTDVSSGAQASRADQLAAVWAAELEEDFANRREADGHVALDSRKLEALQQRLLRRFRHRHMFRILWRDLTGAADLYATLEELSVLADACIRVADEWAYKAVSARYGTPVNEAGQPQRLIILGMGKLGGYELNVSSDIDLICLWPDAGETRSDQPGQKSADNSEFFRRSVQGLTKLLNSVTEDGFAYRVDTRLRPFGDSGPLVMNFDGLENYYLTQARDWERYAMIKARAVTGDPQEIKVLMGLVTPFVYRRYLDYNAFDSLRDLKRKIAVSVYQKGMVDNIKLGAGGIREVEFIGQAFQLVRGGQDKRLRLRPIVQVLKLLAHDGLLATMEVDSLLKAYAYLRRVENAVQMMRDEQVHSLPVDNDDKLRLLAIMDENDWESFRKHLLVHQNNVTASFEGLFELESENKSGDEGGGQVVSDQSIEPQDVVKRMANVWTIISSEELDDESRGEVLATNGFEAGEELLSTIAGISRGAFYQRLTAQAQERIARIAPLIMNHALDTSDPAETLNRCLALVRAVAGRSGYLQVLCDQTPALARLVRLFSQSRWLAKFVLRQPMVIDELLAGHASALYLQPNEIRAKTQEQVARLHDADLDVQMDSLRHYRQGREMRIACAQLDGTLTLMQVSDQLSWLAESLIEAVLTLVEIPLKARHGCPEYVVGGVRMTPNPAVVAYGKLGGLELGFASDLDLVFMHDSTGEKQVTNGDKPIENSIYYAKLAQKLVHFMSTTTPAGMLYEIDLRLRPNGNSGVLVSSVEAFANYQKGDAWTWEHQALIRARMVFGSTEIRKRFALIRASVLRQSRSEDELRAAVASMRERMRSALGNKNPDSMHLKQDSGGVADIEFVVQYLVLAYSRKHPELLEFTDNMRILDLVESLALLPDEDTKALKAGYLALRERLHRQALQEGSAIVPLDESLQTLRDSIVEIRSRILGDG